MRYGLVVLAVVSAIFFRAFLVSVYKVPSQMMAPNILAGDFVLASQIAYGLKLPWADEVNFRERPKRGDLVVYFKNSKIFIKRVVALEGDTVEYEGGVLSINSQKCSYKLLEASGNEQASLFEENCTGFSQRVFKPLDSERSQNIQRIYLSGATVFVLSDNRIFDPSIVTYESVSFDEIIGKPIFVWMSYSSTQDFISKSLGVRWNRILTKLN